MSIRVVQAVDFRQRFQNMMTAFSTIYTFCSGHSES